MTLVDSGVAAGCWLALFTNADSPDVIHGPLERQRGGRPPVNVTVQSPSSKKYTTDMFLQAEVPKFCFIVDLFIVWLCFLSKRRITSGPLTVSLDQL